MADKLENTEKLVTTNNEPEYEPPEERHGFLPIETNAFDRGFISVVLWVALSLFWLRFLEPLGLSIWIAVAISIVLAVTIIRKG